MNGNRGMTREEYENLLKSDYWKGYSYSLIKERNFTCEDCGRQFMNERNKLQVHHLVYRDANPWSYKPEELVVLCEECHKRRHGIMPEPENESRPIYNTPNNSQTVNNRNVITNRSPWPEEKAKSFNWSYIILGVLLFLFISFGIEYAFKNGKIETTKKIVQPTLIHEPAKATTQTKENTNRKAHRQEKVHSISKNSEDVPQDKVSEQTQRKEVTEELSTLDLLEKKQHADVVKRAKRAGVSTEGSTIDIIERINHAEVVKQAKRAGVSTDGSTIDIIERINRKEMEKYNY